MVTRTPDIVGRYNPRAKRERYDRGGWKRRPQAPPPPIPDDWETSLTEDEKKQLDKILGEPIRPDEPLLPDSGMPNRWGGGPPTVQAPRPLPRPVGPRINPFVDPGTGLEPKGWYPGDLFNAPLSQFELDQWPSVETPKYIEAKLEQMTPGVQDILSEYHSEDDVLQNIATLLSQRA